jgi:hypothetical protein
VVAPQPQPMSRTRDRRRADENLRHRRQNAVLHFLALGPMAPARSVPIGGLVGVFLVAIRRVHGLPFPIGLAAMEGRGRDIRSWPAFGLWRPTAFA